VVLDQSDIQAVGTVVFDISPYTISSDSKFPPISGNLDSPVRSSTHFSCNLPFLGTANNNLSFKLSTNKLIVLSAPKLDLAARLALSSENLAGRIALWTIEFCPEGWEVCPFPFGSAILCMY
jgi:hypothetical protein